MATNFPGSLDVFTNPTAVDTLDSPPHDTQHADANDAIEALQAKVGVNSSAVTTSLDYRVTALEGAGAGMETSATPPASPSDGDMWYDTDDGRTYVYYDDGTSAQWVEFGAPAVAHGKILQVVSTTKTDAYSASVAAGATTAPTGLSVTITPTSASSKILVHALVSAVMYQAGTQSVVAVLTRGGTAIGIGDANPANGRANSGSAGADVEGINSIPVLFLDSPATTSATTYAIEIGHTWATAQNVFVNRSVSTSTASDVWRTSSTITVMEVAA